MAFAEVVIQSGLSLGHRTAESVVIALQMGAELGFPPMQALRLIAVINAKPSPSSDALVAAVLASGKAQYFYEAESTDQASTWATKRVGSEKEQTCRFTMADAETAKLTGKENWTKYPKRMLAARAKGYLARDAYADVVGGLLSVEEATDIEEPKPAFGPPPRKEQPADKPRNGGGDTSSALGPPPRKSAPRSPKAADPPPVVTMADMLTDSLETVAVKRNRPAGAISDQQIRQLYAMLRAVAGNDDAKFTTYRDRLKIRIAKEFGAEHIEWLQTKDFSTVKQWLAAAEKRNHA